MTVQTIPTEAAFVAADVRTTQPLCVDMDGTLLATDTLYESLALGVRDWRVVLRLPFWLLRGKADFKRRLAARVQPDVSLLPVNAKVVEYVRQQRAQGRHVVLVSAADQALVDSVQRHIPLFDEALGSADGINLRGASKAEVLVGRYGARGFCYAGNDASDLEVWKRAGSGVLVRTTPSVAARARRLCQMVEVDVVDRGARLRAFVRALRPHQWAKNLLVFMPMLAGAAVANTAVWLAAITAFCAFCATASSIYLINDLMDLEADRRHPRKRLRPLASGALPLKHGFIAAPLLLATGLVVGWLAGIVEIVALYAALSITYSFWFKRRQLIDVFVLSALYTVRLFAGGEATGYRVTLWLLAFSTFLFLALAMVKRVGELVALRVQKRAYHGREYSFDDIPILTIMGVASSFAATLVFALYIQDQAAGGVYSAPALLWLNIPLILFWQCRIWLSTARGYMHDDPIVYSASDWVSWTVGAGFIIVHMLAFFAIL